MQKSERPAVEQSDFFVRPWMERFLPASIPRRDFVMCLVLHFSSVVAGVALIKFGMETLGVGLFCVVSGCATWHYYERMIDRWKTKRQEK
jgi:hypothetical protein